MFVFFAQPFLMRKRKPQFLPVLPSSDLSGWISSRLSSGSQLGVGSHPVGVADTLLSRASCSNCHPDTKDVLRVGSVKRKRKDMPVVKTANKGDSQRVFDVAMDPIRRAVVRRRHLCNYEQGTA